MTWPITYRRKIRFSDTDAQAIVFNPNYAVYIDDTMTDYFDGAGLTWEAMTSRGVDSVLARSEIDFRSAARLGEELVIGARIAKFGRTSFTVELRGWAAGDERVVIEAKQVWVVIDHASKRSAPIPGFLVEAVERFQGSPVPR
jgi:acyl-CoA thioester hydrolase